MLRLAVYLKDYKKQCILGPIFKFLEVIFELLLPTIMALIVNKGVAHKDIGYILRMGGLMLIMAVLGYASACVCQRYAAQASQGFGTALRGVVFKKILSFSYTEIDRFGAATLTTRLTNDINQLQLWVAMMIRLLVRSPFICVGSIIMSFFLDYRLALILLAATPVLVAIIYFITKYTTPLYHSYQKKLDRLALLVRETLSGVRVIRAFSKMPAQTKRFEQANDTLTENGLVIGRLSALFNPLTSATVNLVIVLILWVAGAHINVSGGGLEQGQIIAFINYVAQLLNALLVLSNLIILLTKAMACADRVNEVLDIQPDMPQTRTQKQVKVVNTAPAIEFRSVSFGYQPGGDQVLEQVSLSIPRGETVGIIGGTGSGKTTLINLIARFYDVTQGTVLVDGVPVTQYPLDALRKKIGLVPQRALLFTGTVAENIRWGAPDADMQAVRTAAAIAQAAEFIEQLPEGYDAPVQRGGKNFSGGQRQRLTIARALVSRPDILILDDSFSALDFLTEAKLRRALREHSHGQTVLLVSQRVGVVKNADRIVVMEDGQIAGIGTHAQLFSDCETYREICLSQLSAEEAQL